ncbi:hypothetical protein KKE14_02710 [Patescibacteria group bacterium]|nr:hypothetical protein [Patescibacteria group bacterium]
MSLSTFLLVISFLLQSRAIAKINRGTIKALIFTTSGDVTIKGWRIKIEVSNKPDLVIPIVIEEDGGMGCALVDGEDMDKIQKLFAKLHKGKRKQVLLRFIDQNGGNRDLLWEKASKNHRCRLRTVYGVY